MKYSNFLWLLVFALVVSVLPSCKKKKNDVTPAVKTGTVQVKFDYVFGQNMLPWELGKTFVHARTGDTITFTNLRFYVSNVKLQKTDGSWWIHPDSYFLLDAKTGEASTITIDEVPEGDYVKMEYTMGVDSIKNVTGAHDGALSFTHGMFWDWNSGYIMLKAEGTSPNSPSGNFALHFGGFRGSDNVVTVKTTDFAGATLKVKSNGGPVLHLQANTARFWHSAPGLDSIYVIHAPGGMAVTMAKDFYNSIIFTTID